MPDSDAARARSPRRSRRFTVLLPVLRPPWFLPHAVRSVLGQTVEDLELCIVCDGAPPETVAAARDLAAVDQRIHVFRFAKGERHGEAHRAAVLDGARSRFVAQIGDDDLWYPDHLAVLARLLARADLAAVCQVRLMADGVVRPVPTFSSLADPHVRERMLSQTWNFFGPSEAGYRLAAYRALPVGWSPAPPDLFSDLFMWRKFLRQPDLTFASRFAVTSLKFGAADWSATGPEQQAAIIAREAALLHDRTRRDEITRIARDGVDVSLRAEPTLRARLLRPFRTALDAVRT
ncbi:glycosyltransferase family 2 protein [Aquibium carbonis]|uniref:glycosyltransferase family 2 protein n=1 Tax=Aquibium carbonis TaxID=2495581 RepID=UPI0014791F40|nr:glycosyltransferase family 2 protein [Aquibium carbonis]